MSDAIDHLNKDRIRLRLTRTTGFDLDCDIVLPSLPAVTVLFGPSGCGKTTILRAAAGLERARGFVRYAGNVWQDDENAVFVPTYARRIGYVFQEASLFTHMNVIDNLRYGLKRIPDAHGEERLKEAVELLGIGHLLDRRTQELSGGERQRCAIARSLVIRPTALFMDEPLSALDQDRRNEILPWIERIKRELKVPILYVTHSPEEVMRLADHLVMLENGKVIDAGPVGDVWLAHSRKKGGKAHKTSLVIGRVEEKDAQWSLMSIRAGDAHFWVRDSGAVKGDEVRLMVHSDNVSLATVKPVETSIQNIFQARIVNIAPTDDAARVWVDLDAGGTFVIAEVTARAAQNLGLHVGMNLWAQVKAVSIC